MKVALQIAPRPGHPDFLDLPWGTPLEEWESERLVEVPRGISRHVVRFVNYDGVLFALKQLPRPLAEREYRLLRALRNEGLPVVEAVGVVISPEREDSGQPPAGGGDAVLLTRHLEFSLPYRTLFTGRGVPDLRNRLLDSLAQLLVRLHVAGFFWGDCSLSNTLFRRDAERLAAYLVDAETGELHPSLTGGQRGHDLLLAEENIAGELMDVQAGYGVADELDPAETSTEIRHRYDYLWSEITREEVFTLHERYRIDARLRRLNELGFDVEQMELIGGPEEFRLRLLPRVVEVGQSRRHLLVLTGLDVQEHQARRLLNDIAGFGAQLEQVESRRLPDSVVAFRWLAEVFEPANAGIPAEMREKLEPAQLYHELLEHRWFLSEAAGRDVGMQQAVASYVDTVLRFAPDERRLLFPPVTEEDVQEP
jgi:hypothetical protein